MGHTLILHCYVFHCALHRRVENGWKRYLRPIFLMPRLQQSMCLSVEMYQRCVKASSSTKTRDCISCAPVRQWLKRLLEPTNFKHKVERRSKELSNATWILPAYNRSVDDWDGYQYLMTVTVYLIITKWKVCDDTCSILAFFFVIWYWITANHHASIFTEEQYGGYLNWKSKAMNTSSE